VSSTESFSYYNNLEKKSTSELLQIINNEDKKVALVIEESLELISDLIDNIYMNMKSGGRLFYIGSGTPGRLGVVDASECPPTFGVDNNVIIGLIAGGDSAIRNSIEGAEDDTIKAWEDLKKYQITKEDSVIGITASGKTPYVVGGLRKCKEEGIFTGLLTCNKKPEASKYADVTIETIVGPEVVTGSTRMKSGTAQKLVLNMISTSLMIKLGKVKGNKMVDMKLSNSKLIDRGVRFVSDELKIDYNKAKKLLKESSSVREVIEKYKKKSLKKDS
jgi:N-acetylmuramic acid 6-phosphate etherase